MILNSHLWDLPVIFLVHKPGVFGMLLKLGLLKKKSRKKGTQNGWLLGGFMSGMK